MKTNLLLIISCVIAALSSSIMAGGPEGSGGSDYFRPVRAWFLSQDDSKTIKACYEVAKDFGVSEQELSEMVRSSFKVWSSYMIQKKLLDHTPPKAYKIVTALDLYPFCKGNEDLKFYFGTDDMKVVRARTQYYKPFGFAELDNDRQPQEPWSTGFIWIANSKSLYPDKLIPTWITAKDSLRALLIHEIGHVFGNGHVDDTIMTAHLAQYLINDTAPESKPRFVSAYNSIDSIIELTPCFDCSVSYRAARQFDGSPISLGNDDLSNAYRFLLGKDPSEPLSASFTRDEKGAHEMVFIDANGEYHFPIRVLSLAATKTDTALLFNGLGGRYFSSQGRSYFGEIQIDNGNKIPVAINYNMDRRKMAVIPLGLDLNPKPLFLAAP